MGAGMPAGNYGIYTSSDVVTWGRPGSSANIITLLPGSSQATIFGYDTGAQMVGLTAPARRVGFFLATNQGGKLTRNGWNFFEAAITWAVSGN
jgi:hypothetical protein